MSETTSPNAAQAAFWNDAGGRTWSELQTQLDAQMEPIGQRVIETLRPKRGERVLDVGCGAGRTSQLLAERVGPQGEVLGVDISQPLLDLARRRATDADLRNLTFVEADAQTYAFEPSDRDALFSRFGVMFFDDPKAAFGNLLRSLKPRGRLAFACWRSLAENPMLREPIEAAAPHVELPPPLPPGSPGPFAFADAARVEDILSAAGFEAISVTPLDMPIGGASLEDALTLAVRLGPLGAALREKPDALPTVREEVRRAFSRRLDHGKVWFEGAMWLVTANRPGS